MKTRYRILEEHIERSGSFLRGLGLAMSSEQNAYVFRGPGTSVSVYRNGTVIVSCGDERMGKLLSDYFWTLPFDYDSYISSALGISLPDTWIGSDESGKGDYFGPLVVAGVCMDRETAGKMFRAGLTDSKRLAEDFLYGLEADVKSGLGPSKYEIITISPDRYNELHARMGSVVRMLVWAHSKVISTLSERAGCRVAVVDKFAGGRSADEMEHSAHGVKVYQFTRGEREMGVAAASVLATSQFNRSIASLSERTGIRLPKGAGKEVQSIAASILRERGEEFYRTVAKTDFTLPGHRDGS